MDFFKKSDVDEYNDLLREYNDLLREVERLRLDRADIDHAYAFARNKAMMLEREAVVAYLLRDYDTDDSRDRAAEAIRNGEHRREERWANEDS